MYLLQEEPEMQELQLNIDSTHEGDCKKPEETFTEVSEIHNFVL